MTSISADQSVHSTDDLQRKAMRLEALLNRQHQVRERLWRDREHFRLLVERCGDWLWEVDEAGCYVYTSPQVEAILGYSPRELHGKTPFEFMPEDEAAHVAGQFRDAAANGRPIVRLINRNRHKDGRIITLETSAEPILDDGGRLTGYRGIDRDITERQRMEDHLRHMQKLESLGVLAGGIAHDFNNLLMAMMGSADLAMDYLPSSSPAAPLLQDIIEAGRKAAHLCTQMLAYSGRTRLQFSPTDLDEVVRGMSSFMPISVTGSTVVQTGLHGKLPPVWVDAVQIRQALLNLLANATESMKNGDGVITIRTGAAPCDRETLNGMVLGPDLSEGNYVFVSVEDNGCGMTPADVERVFDPFFTTKFMGRGLGMAAVLGIVRAHAGAIRVRSKPGQGTTVDSYLPSDLIGPPSERRPGATPTCP